MNRRNINVGQRLSPSTRKILKLRQRAFQQGGASLEIQIPADYIKDISRNLNHDITKDIPIRNLLNWSEEFDNAVWAKVGSTITANAIANPINGLVTADKLIEDTNSTHNISQYNIKGTNSDDYNTYSVYLKASGRSILRMEVLGSGNSGYRVTFNVTLGIIVSQTGIGPTPGTGSGSIINVGGDWYKCTVTGKPATLSNTHTNVVIGILDNLGNSTYTGDGVSGLYIYGAQLETGSAATPYQQTQTANTDTGASLIMSANTIGESRLFNCKPELRNLATWSQDMTNAVWGKGSATITSTTGIAPDGTSTACLFDDTNASNAPSAVYRISNIIALTTTVTYSLYTKKVNLPTNGIRNFLLRNETTGTNFDTVSFNYSTTGPLGVTGWFSEDVGNGWFKLSYTRSIGINIGDSLRLFYGRTGAAVVGATDTWYVWGAQLEAGSTATTYQRTTDGIIDFQATRATTATVVQKDGTIGNSCYNLLQRSEEFDNAVWVKGNLSVNANAISNPINGKIDADKIIPNTVNAAHLIRENFSNYPSGQTHTFSVYAKAGEYEWLFMEIGDGSVIFYQVWFNLTLGTIGATNNSPIVRIENVGNGWYRCSITKTLVNSGTTFFSINVSNTNGNNTFSGDGTSGLYVWGAQVTISSTPKDYLKTTNILNVPSIDYSLGSDKPALLVEPQRTNLVLRSEEFDNAYWAKTNVTVVTNTTISPNGSLTADSLLEGTLNANHYIQLTSVLSATIGTTITYSIFLKYNGRQWVILDMYNGSDYYAYFDIVNGVIGDVVGSGVSASITPFINGWYRCSITRTLTTTNYSVSVNPVLSNGGSSIYLGDITKGYYIWGVQVEVGSNSTSYIPTTTATVTRNRYTSFVDLRNDNLLNKDNFTLFFEGKNIYSTGTTNAMIYLGNSTNGGFSNDSIGIQASMIGYFFTSSVATIVGSGLPDNTNYKFAIQRNGTAVKFFRNGVQLGVTQTIPIFDYPYLVINSDTTGGTHSIQKIALWKHTKTDAECLALFNIVYSAETQAIINRANTSGFALPPVNTLQELDRFIITLKNAGIWSKIDHMFNFAYNNISSQNFSLINIKSPTSLEGQIVGGMTYQASGFIGNAIDGYVNISGLFYTNVTTGSAQIGTVVYKAALSTEKLIFSSSSLNRLVNAVSTDQRIHRNEQLSAAVDLTGIGFMAIDRNIQAGYIVNKGITTTFTFPSTAIATSSSFQIPANTSGGLYSNAGVSFIYIGAHLTEAETQTIRSAYNFYLNSIGLTPYA